MPNNNTYQKINWGWLNDYNGYKFAPITFVEQLYDKDGYSFQDQYNQQWNLLQNGGIISGKALQLVNEDGEPYNTSSVKPIYFKDGKPDVCTNIEVENIQCTDINASDINASVVKFSKPLRITIGETSKEIITTDDKTSLSWGHDEIGYADNSTGLISIDSQTFKGSKTFLSTIYTNGLIDHTLNYNTELQRSSGGITFTRNDNTKYCAIYDNGSGLWIGGQQVSKTSSESSHPFPGQVYISTGYNKIENKGNDTVLIGIPEYATETEEWSHRVYPIAHKGNLIELIEDLEFIPNYQNNNFITSKTMYIQHPYAKSAFSQTNDISIAFTDNAGTAHSNYLGEINSTYSIKTNRSYMYMRAYGGESDIADAYAYFYIYVGKDDKNNAIAEAGVKNSPGVLSDEKTYIESTDNIVFMGAAWNDYAEFRDQLETIEPGYCVASTDDGKVYKTTEKFQACDGIVSDTYGFAIGRSETYQTPLAVSGRVLAYCEGDRYDYHSGDTVCAGPEGKVCKMTREEIKEYPDRIIGIVSEIPEYKEWTGKKVNNRIWVKVK